MDSVDMKPWQLFLIWPLFVMLALGTVVVGSISGFLGIIMMILYWPLTLVAGMGHKIYSKFLPSYRHPE
jgi:hypothetical protein